MDSLTCVIECCGFVWISLSLVLTFVDFHGRMDLRKVVNGFVWICVDSLEFVIECCDLHGSP